eukprot:m.285683 g.285683  ORF g.285683 m.285683 type:complete len:86 (+) comp16206_c0_seq12:2337-2594(+)
MYIVSVEFRRPTYATDPHGSDPECGGPQVLITTRWSTFVKPEEGMKPTYQSSTRTILAANCFRPKNQCETEKKTVLGPDSERQTP